MRRHHAPDHAERQAAMTNSKNPKIYGCGSLSNHRSKQTLGWRPNARSGRNQVDSLWSRILFDIYPV